MISFEFGREHGEKFCDEGVRRPKIGPHRVVQQSGMEVEEVDVVTTLSSHRQSLHTSDVDDYLAPINAANSSGLSVLLLRVLSTRFCFFLFCPTSSCRSASAALASASTAANFSDSDIGGDSSEVVICRGIFETPRMGLVFSSMIPSSESIEELGVMLVLLLPASRNGG